MMMMATNWTISVGDVATDSDGDDVSTMNDEDDASDDVHVTDVRYWLVFVNLNTYVEMNEDLVVLVRI